MSSLEFRLKKVDETLNCLLDESKLNDLMGEKYKKTCKYLNYAEHFLTSVSTVTCCVSVFGFASLDFVPVRIMTFVVAVKLCAITTENKKV